MQQPRTYTNGKSKLPCVEHRVLHLFLRCSHLTVQSCGARKGGRQERKRKEEKTHVVCQLPTWRRGLETMSNSFQLCVVLVCQVAGRLEMNATRMHARQRRERQEWDVEAEVDDKLTKSWSENGRKEETTNGLPGPPMLPLEMWVCGPAPAPIPRNPDGHAAPVPNRLRTAVFLIS